MKNERRRKHDLELLSTYLDNALNPRQKSRLEARLSQDPELREHLEQLRFTKRLVGSLSRVHAPRNFTLTPEMVKVRKPKKQPFFTYLRLASSLAAILLVVLFGFELFLGGELMVKMQSSEPAMESARIADEASPEPLIIWGQQGMGGGAGDTDAVGLGGAEPEQYALEAPLESEEEVPPQEEMLEESFTLEQPQTDFTEAAEGKSPILGINSDAGGEVIDRSQPTGQDQSLSPALPAYLRWVQFGLAAIAIGGAFTLLIFSIKRKRSGQQ
jgi:hypothetical protein